MKSYNTMHTEAYCKRQHPLVKWKSHRKTLPALAWDGSFWRVWGFHLSQLCWMEEVRWPNPRTGTG